MAQINQPKDLGSQLEDLLTYINNTLKIRGIAYHIRTFSEGPPACEMGTGPAKPFVSHTSIVANDPPAPPSRVHYDFKGRSTENARECPHCGSICYHSGANEGDRVGCLSCGRVYIWS